MDFTLNTMTLLGPDARGRHRHRRCDRRAGEHLPEDRRGGAAAVRRRPSRALARSCWRSVATSLSLVVIFLPGRVHDRLRAAVHLSVRPDDGVRHHGVAARQRHADADAGRADARPHGRRATPGTSASTAGSTAPTRAACEWSLAHRGVIVAISAGRCSPPPSRSPATSAGRSCPPRIRESSTSPSTRPRARRCRAWRRWCWRSASACRPLPGVAHVMPTIFERVNHSHICSCSWIRSSERDRVAGRGRDGGAGSHGAVSRVSADRRVQDPIGGGESANWPILVNLYGPDLQHAERLRGAS